MNNTPQSSTDVLDAPTTTAYSEQQIVFCLNTISNISALFNETLNIKADTTLSIKAILADAGVQNYIGNWEPVWGPAVNVTDLNKAENTMYVAYNSDTDMYVVAIAGTDPSCLADWLNEDFDIMDTVQWPYNSSLSPMPVISKATSNGLGILVNMPDPCHRVNSSHVPAKSKSKKCICYRP